MRFAMREGTKRWACSAMLALLACAASAQDARRDVLVTLPAAPATQTFNDALGGFETVDYRVTLHVGERLHVHLATSNLSNCFDIYAPGAEKPLFQGGNSGAEHLLAATTAGEYRIRVYLLRFAARDYQSAEYTLTLTSRADSA